MSKHQWWCRNPPLSPLGPSRTASQRGRKMSKVSDLAETPFPEHTEKGGPGARNFTPRFVRFGYVFPRTASGTPGPSGQFVVSVVFAL